VTQETTTFAGPDKSRMHQYIIELAHRGQMIGVHTQNEQKMKAPVQNWADHTVRFRWLRR
jgi:hypothetical protein